MPSLLNASPRIDQGIIMDRMPPGQIYRETGRIHVLQDKPMIRKGEYYGR